MAQFRRNKYNATKVDKYDSKAEYNYAIYLKDLERKGEIRNLREKPRYNLIPKIGKHRACDYIADFEYLDRGGFKHVVDVKGVETEVFKIKRKLMRFVHNVEVEIVR